MCLRPTPAGETLGNGIGSSWRRWKVGAQEGRSYSRRCRAATDCDELNCDPRLRRGPRWDREGKLIPDSRSATNWRLYSASEIARFAGLVSKEEAARAVVCCRVSSAAQKPDLDSPRRVLEEFVAAKGLAGVDFLEEIGGGLNFKRKKFLAGMGDISNRQIRTLMLAHRD